MEIHFVKCEVSKQRRLVGVSTVHGDDDVVVDQFETPVGATWRAAGRRSESVHLDKCLDSSGDSAPGSTLRSRSGLGLLIHCVFE